MKLKHLFAMALLAVGGSAWADDVWKDVTSTYLTNADLNGEYSSFRQPRNDRDIYKPDEWSIYYNNGSQYDETAMDQNSNRWSDFSSLTLPDNAGSKTYWIRFYKDPGTLQQLSLYQTTNEALKVGSYKLSVTYYKSGIGGDSYLYVGDNETQCSVTTKGVWANYSKSFAIDQSKTIELGIRSKRTNKQNNDSYTLIFGFDNFKLEYNLTKALADKISEANSTKIAGDASKYLTALEAAITAAVGKTSSQDADELEQTISDLSSAIDAYTEKSSIINALINVRKEIARAEAYSVVKTENVTAYAAAIQAAKDAIDEDADIDYSDVILAMQNFKVEDYSYVTATYPEVFKNSFNWPNTYRPTWTSGNESWTGTSASYNNDYENDMNRKGTMELHLAKGSYAFVAAGRAASSATAYIKVGDIQTYFTSKNNKGIGVDKEGKANFTNTPDTYANNNEGFGWEWRFITFDVTEDEGKDVTLEIGYSGNGQTWASISAPVLYMTSETKAAIDLAAAKDELQTIIDAAPSETANVGTGAFQIPDAAATTYTDARTAAQTAHDAQDATLASIAEAKSTFEAAINTFRAAELNAPAAGKKFTFTLGGTNSWNGKAITYIAGGRNDQGNYGVSYEQEPNAIYAQAFTMTQVEGNKYKMSQTDADSQERYLCTAQGGYSTGDNYQIRTTTDAEKALVVEVVPTDAEGVYNLKNTAANANIGSKDNGVYTKDNNGTYVVDFTITEAQKAAATMSISAAAKYGTFVAPFAVVLPNGVEAYTLTVNEGAVVKSDALNPVPANTPVLVYAEEGLEATTFYGWGLATKDEYTVDNLVGNLADPKVIPSSDANSTNYLLQKQYEVVAFYMIGKENNTLKVGTNRCYLNVPATQEARDFFLLDGEETAISSVGDEAAADKVIYDLSGRRVQKAQKGLYIINGKKVIY